MLSFYHTVFYNPLYNGLIFLLSILPGWAGIGVAVIIFTCIIKLVLFPLSRTAIKTQVRMKELEPKIAELRQKHKDNPQELSMQTMKLYKEFKVNPFSGILLILIQLPIIIALYSIFRTGGLPMINHAILYSFVHAPVVIKTTFFEVSLTQRSLLFGLIAAVSQFYQVRLSIPEIKVDPNKKGENSFRDDLARSMNMQMRYVLPFFVFVISYSVNAAVPIYWTTSNLFAIGQEVFVRRKLIDESNQKLKQSLIIK